MSIAEKFEIIADEVYAKGVEDGKAQGGNTEEAYNQGFEDGKKSEYDLFWDGYQNKGKPSCYKFAFAYKIFNDAIYNPKYPIITSGAENVNSADIFAYSRITDTKVDIDVTRNPSVTRAFNNATELVTIRKLIITDKITFANTFDNCIALKNIIIEGVIGNNINFGDSPLLTLESITSIINALKTLGEGETKTLTLHATAKQKVVENAELLETMNLKGWTLV